MKKRAIYAGSFDPVTLGHLDIIKRASKLFDIIIVGILNNSSKKYLFSIEERKQMLEEELVLAGVDNAKIVYFDGLLIDMCRAYNASTIVRGLRAVTDFEYELQIAQVNKAQAPDIDTVFFTTNLEYTYVSSSVSKEIASYNGDLSKLVGKYTEQKLKEKYNKKE
jgi:pantetheine-phosphate adenylyltransferase, bacterial